MNKYKFSFDLSSFFGREEEVTPLQAPPEVETSILPRPKQKQEAIQEAETGYDPYSFIPDFATAYEDAGGAAPIEEGRQRYINVVSDFLSDMQTTTSTALALESTLAPATSLRPPELPERRKTEAKSSDAAVEALEEAVSKALGADAPEGSTATNEEGLVSRRPKKRPDSLMPSEGSGTLLDFIAKGEGSYNSSNRGTKDEEIVGSSHSTTRGGKQLSEMTIGEIQQLQSIKDPDNADRLFAVGKYQLIPSTMSMAVKSLNLSEDQVFDEQTQEALGMWLMMQKRPALGAYIKGEHDDLDKAVTAAAREWASLPDPKTGKSFYGQGNKAQHSVEETRRAIRGARAAYTRGD